MFDIKLDHGESLHVAQAIFYGARSFLQFSRYWLLKFYHMFGGIMCKIIMTQFHLALSNFVGM